MEIQRRVELLQPGQRVVDLGCWPGGWLQVAAAVVGPTGRVVGVDRVAIDPPLEIANVVALCGDITEPALCPLLRSELGGPADVVLSDAAPKLTGVRATDRALEAALLESVGSALEALLRPGGSLLLKLMEGPEAQAIERQLRTRFSRSRSLRPEASRKGSSERYLLGTGFRAG